MTPLWQPLLFSNYPLRWVTSNKLLACMSELRKASVARQQRILAKAKRFSVSQTSRENPASSTRGPTVSCRWMPSGSAVSAWHARYRHAQRDLQRWPTVLARLRPRPALGWWWPGGWWALFRWIDRMVRSATKGCLADARGCLTN